MNSRLTLSLVILVVLATGFWLVVGSGPSDGSVTVEPGVVASPQSNDGEALPVPATVQEDVRREEAAPQVVQPTEEADASEAPQPVAVYDADAKATLRLRIVDPDGSPVPDAVVTINGLRSKTEQGTWFGYRGTEPKGSSGPDGWVSLLHYVWVNRDGESSGVDLTVEHPEFVPFNDHSFTLDTEVVVLERGATVVCTAWFRDESATLPDTLVEADRASGVGRSDWTPLADGRLATSRFAPGVHCVTVSIEHPELGKLYSMPTTFEVGPVGWETLHVQIMEPVRLQGELDPRVPRPVVNGKVRAIFRGGGVTHLDPLITRSVDVDVAPDGSFVLENARPGECFLFALAEGWAVQRERPATPQEAGIRLTGEENAEAAQTELAALPPGRFVYPSAALPMPMADQPYVLPMEPTGSLEVTVSGPDGPIKDAFAIVNPNYRVRLVGSNIVPWREWNARTDAEGQARFHDLPSDASVWITAAAGGFQMSAEDRKTMPSTPIQSGETSRLEIILEPFE